jgi:hypothetical protein
MTRTGADRDLYHRTIEPRPSRFSKAYAAWAERADQWAAVNPWRWF